MVQLEKVSVREQKVLRPRFSEKNLKRADMTDVVRKKSERERSKI